MSTPTEVAPQPVRKRSLYRGDPGMWAWVLHRITGAVAATAVASTALVVATEWGARTAGEKLFGATPFDLGDAAAVAALAVPLPERPYRQTRLGTLFHAWVEQRAGVVAAGATLDDALWDDAAAEDAGSGAAPEASELAQLQERFLASEWAHLQPIEVETEIDVAMPDALGDGRPHVIICKLDAVYRRGDRIEIVDWKTGRAPRTAAERDERMLQLQLYRQAYHAKHGVPVDQIDVVLFYVADGLILRG